MESIVTVIEPATSIDLTTLATVKAELGIDDTSQDANLLRWIRQSSSAIAAYCNRVFGLETIREEIIGAHNVGPIALRRRPVQVINSISIGGSDIGDDYRLDARAGLLYRGSVAGFGFRSYPWMWWGDIVVEYDAGYELIDDLPHAVERACVLMVKQFHYGGERDPYLRSEEIPGVASFSYGFGPSGVSRSDMPPEVASLLAPYKELCFA